MDKIGRTIRRRRREGKTDYKARLGVIKSSLPRIVIRKTNRYIIVQLVETDIAQDKIIVSVSSKDLLGKGWPKELEGSLKNLSAAYLTGILLANKAKKKEKCILDIGLQRNIHRGRLYATLKGLIDGGMEIPHNQDCLPDEEMLSSNKKTSEILKTVREKIKHG